MKSYLPLLAFVILLTSCSSVYKSGQTPDDVYFSPERPREEYVRVDNRNDRRYQQNDELDREDRYLRMKTRNRRYELLDDYDYYSYNGASYYRYNDYYRMNAYRYNPNWTTWNYRFSGMYNNFDPFIYNPYYYNPYHYNPYYSGVVYGNVNPNYNRPRTTNLDVYDRNRNPYSNTPKGNSRTYSYGSDRNENYRGSNTNAGGFLRNVFGGENSSSTNSNKSASSSNSSSNNSGSSSSGSSGSSRAPVRKF